MTYRQLYQSCGIKLHVNKVIQSAVINDFLLNSFMLVFWQQNCLSDYVSDQGDEEGVKDDKRWPGVHTYLVKQVTVRTRNALREHKPPPIRRFRISKMLNFYRMLRSAGPRYIAVPNFIKIGFWDAAIFRLQVSRRANGWKSSHVCAHRGTASRWLLSGNPAA